MGKLALFLVLGFSAIFLVSSHNSNTVSNRAVDNMIDYHAKSMAYNIAVSGANLAANEIFMDDAWTTGFKNIDFQDGKLNVSVLIVDKAKNIRKIVASGTYRGINKTINVTLQPSKFSKFAYYSNSEGSSIWWTSNDTVWGPFHTQDNLRSSGHPVFYGKATIKKKIIYYNGKKKGNEPRFLGGFEKGVNLPLPATGLSNLETDAKNGGLYLNSAKDTVYITFKDDSVKIRYGYKDKDSTYLTSSVASNGVIFAKDKFVRLKGTVAGQYTVAASYNGTKKKGGTIYLDDDIVLKNDPMKNPYSTDVLGIVAEQNVYITDNKANNNHINIQASIYCEKGGFGAQNYDKRPVSGNINLLGGIIQNTRQAVGTFGKSGIQSGFSKRYRYDDRFMYMSPPSFPNTGEFEIVSWQE